MSQDLVFRIALLACFVSGQLIRQYILRTNRSGKIVNSVNYTWEMLMYRLGVFLFTLPIFYGLTSWVDFANFYLPLWLRWAGFLVSALATVVLVLSHNTLGSNWTGQLNIQEKQVLVVQGIYAYIRHPMYLSFLLAAIGTFLLSANWFVSVPLFVWFWVMYLGRVNHEEQMMIDEFGEQYTAYMDSTGRLFPKWLS